MRISDRDIVESGPVILGAIASVVMASLLGGCGGESSFPRDPKKTLEHVRGGSLRVGLLENPPWVIRTSGEPAGLEVELARELSKELGATPQWQWGGEQRQMEALERYELDLLLGGLTKENPWKSTVGLTSDYFENRIVVAGRGGGGEKIKGMQVAVENGEVTAAYLEKKGAMPVRVEHLREASTPLVAGSEWEARQLGYNQTVIELFTRKHAFAAPPGENAWIKTLDQFLHQHRGEIVDRLRKQNTAP